MRDNPIEEMQLMAFRAFQTWRFPRARRLAERVIELDETRSYPHYLLGEIDRRQHLWQSALQHFIKAVELGRDDARTHYRTGEAAYHIGLPDEARDAFLASKACAEAAGDEASASRAREFLRFLAR